MPQPLSKISPNAQIKLSTAALVDRPDLANLVTQIFAFWAVVEQEIQTLFMRIVDADDASALAVYSMLKTENLQRSALDVVAKTKFGADSEDFEIFTAVLNVAKRAGKARHKLAHWRWGVSPDIPDALLLADPESTKATQIAHHRLRALEPLEGERNPNKVNEILENLSFDTSRILVYKVEDLEKALSEISQASRALFHYSLYLQPNISAELAEALKEDLGPGASRAIDIGTAAEALRQLSNLNLFQEARAQLSRDRSKNPRPPT